MLGALAAARLASCSSSGPLNSSFLLWSQLKGSRLVIESQDRVKMLWTGRCQDGRVRFTEVKSEAIQLHFKASEISSGFETFSFFFFF